ncbi:MAG: transposase [Burkholderiales bacterium]|nr:transposase [Burkholderiales bacterium]
MHTMSEQDTQGRRRRREHSPTLKRELIERSLQPGASVSGIALASGINANLLFKWRRQHLRSEARATAAAVATPVLLPVTIESPTPRAAGLTSSSSSSPPASAPAARANTGVIEIEIGGARVRLRGSVDEVNLRTVLTTLHSLA